MAIPKLRFKEFTDEWQEKKLYSILSNIIDFRGRTPLKLGMDWGGNIPSLSALNVKMGYIDFSLDPHRGSEKLYSKWMSKGVLAKNDLLFTTEAPLGNVALVPDDNKYILSQRVLALKTNSSVKNKFLYQLMISDNFQTVIKKLSTGTTAKGINQRSLEKVKITIPDTVEQQKIAGFLATVDEKIGKLEQKKKAFEKYKKGIMQVIFNQKLRFRKPDGSSYPDWEEKKLGEIAEIKRGASPRPITSEEWFSKNSAVGWVRISDVTISNKLLQKTTQYLSEAGIKRSRFVKAGSIIMSICATIGKPIYTGLDVCIHDGFVVFEKLKANYEFLYYYLCKIEKSWYKDGQPGSQVNLNSTIVGNERILLPYKEEQEKIAEILTSLDKKIELINKELEQAKLFKRSLLQQMFV